MLPDLTPAQLERLAFLAEELGEAQKAVGKILRHGFESCNPIRRGSPTNRQDLERELGDVQQAIQMLCEAKDIEKQNMNYWAMIKARKAARYMHHQINQEEK